MGDDGREVPSNHASPEELVALCAVLAEFPHGAIEAIPRSFAAGYDAKDRELLAVPVGSPVLRCERVTSGVDGRPLLVSEHVFPGHRTEFVVELPQVEPSISPSGLRLVE